MIARFIVNGEAHELAIEPHQLLIEVLRDQLRLTGTKHSCGAGNCGACTILLDGTPVLSCMTLAITARDKEITTIEGLAQGEVLHPIQKAFVDHGAIQCGYCTPGMILSAKATGEAKYAGDIHLPGMLIAKVLRCPHAHAEIARLDTTKAEELAGVAAVITDRDMEGWNFFDRGMKDKPLVAGGYRVPPEEGVINIRKEMWKKPWQRPTT